MVNCAKYKVKFPRSFNSSHSWECWLFCNLNKPLATACGERKVLVFGRILPGIKWPTHEHGKEEKNKIHTINYKQYLANITCIQVSTLYSWQSLALNILLEELEYMIEIAAAKSKILLHRDLASRYYSKIVLNEIHVLLILTVLTALLECILLKYIWKDEYQNGCMLAYHSLHECRTIHLNAQK